MGLYVAIFFSHIPPEPLAPVIKKSETIGECGLNLRWKDSTMQNRAEYYAQRLPTARAYCFAWAGYGLYEVSRKIPLTIIPGR